MPIRFLKNILTARDNESYSLTKLLVIAAVAAMIYKFVKADTVDFQAFGTGLSFVLAVLAGKYFVEDKEPK